MADFVAVIRRAVDSLPSNTPEMRAKVYDKARAAVRRQLENMKPAPPEEMLRRQMDKLEAAILSVDAEHAEALPAEVLPGEEELYAEADAPIAEQSEPPPVVADEPEVYQAEGEPQISAEPASDEESYPAGEEPGTWPQEPEAAAAEPVAYEQPGEANVAEPETAPPQDAVDPIGNPMDDDFPYPVRGPVAPIATGGTEASEWKRLEVPPATGEAAEQAASDGWNWPNQEPAAAEPSNDVETGWNDVPELPALPAGAEDFSAPVSDDVGGSEAHFEQESHAAADDVRMPSVSDFPELAAGAAAISSQLGARRDTADELPEADAPQPAGHSGDHARESDPWNDLEDLIGYNKDAVPAGDAAAGEPAVEAGAAAPRAYRVAPKKRNYTGAILAVIGLLIVAGGGYALWLNRDSLTEIVGGVEDTVPVAANADGDTPVETTAPGGPEEIPATPAGGEDTAAAPPAGADDGVTEESKFTQRLLADGTEVDEGPGPEGVRGAGQSVAELNAPPASGEAAASPDTGEASANPADAAALSGEKMFLYEERIGQTAPTAIEGTVSWSLQREAGTENAREPVVQGRINVPGRGLTALITFKRNTDASLPASHLVEIVFSVPPGFEGGAVDSVQRIAMKQTEQDRGDALIAVPAKITDDFHMIALNDFPDARATNLELMRSRGWMDIPLAYRNGRRALLTLQKGEAGNAAFNEAIREWSATAGRTASGQ